MFFKHFASKNQLPNLSVSRTLVKNELGIYLTVRKLIYLSVHSYLKRSFAFRYTEQIAILRHPLSV